MSDDLAGILESIGKTQSNMMAKIKALEGQVSAAGSTELSAPSGWGHCSPTTPPTNRITVRQGYAWQYDLGSEWLIGKTWQDFQPELPISAFTDAYYYRAIIAWMNIYSFDPYGAFDVWEGADEWATYEQCAADLANQFHFSLSLTNYAYAVLPLCAIAVRNDGTTGVINRYLPVTLTDRSQSSFLQRDLRPWFFGTAWY